MIWYNKVLNEALYGLNALQIVLNGQSKVLSRT